MKQICTNVAKFTISVNKLHIIIIIMKKTVIELLLHTHLDSAAEIGEANPVLHIAPTAIVGVELLLGHGQEKRKTKK